MKMSKKGIPNKVKESCELHLDDLRKQVFSNVIIIINVVRKKHKKISFNHEVSYLANRKLIQARLSSDNAFVSEREVCGSNFGPVKSITALSTARNCYNTSPKKAALFAGAMTRTLVPSTRYTL